MAMQYKEVSLPSLFPSTNSRSKISIQRSPIASCTCWCSTMVVLLTCNEEVGGSSPFTSSSNGTTLLNGAFALSQ